MGNIAEKKGFWIVLISLFVLLIAGLIFSLVMTIKYGEPGEENKEENNAVEKVVGVHPNNTFLTFCNDEKLYAMDADFKSNPVTVLTVTKNGETKEITDANEINAIWTNIKDMNIADATSTEVTPAEYTLTFKRNSGSDVIITFQSPEILTFNNSNYGIADSKGLFDKL